jgi:SPP1 gp7 family putative phage head morphogenesis protein
VPTPVTPWDFIEEQRKSLLKADDVALERLAESYRHHADKVYSLLRQVTGQIEAALERGETPHPNWLWRQQRWQALLVQINNEMQVFGRTATTQLIDHQKAVGVMGLDDSAERLRAVGPGVSFQQLPREAIDMLVAQLQTRAPAGALLHGIAQSTVDGVASEIRESMIREITTGMAIGRNPRDIAKRIFDSVGNQVEDLSYRRAETIVRTESMRTYRAAQTANYRANADVVEGWCWVAALNVYTCPACLAKHLSFHPLSEDMHSHPGCRCTAMPMVSDDVPDLPTGEVWLRDQITTPEGEKRVRKLMKSPERFEMWRDGKVSLADLGTTVPNRIWGASEQVTPLYKLRRVAEGKEPSRPIVRWEPTAPRDNDANPLNGDGVDPTIKEQVIEVRKPGQLIDSLPRRATIENEAIAGLREADEAAGFDIMEYATGIVPDGDSTWVSAKVTTSEKRGRVVRTMVEHGRTIKAERMFFPDEKSVYHANFKIDKSLKGAGVKSFAMQVQTYRRAGYKKITTLAARVDGEYNGYYTWARFGFDAELGELYAMRAEKAGFKGVKRVSELMRTKAGREWWLEHGVTMDMEFDLSDNSHGIAVLEAYIEERMSKGTFTARRPSWLSRFKRNDPRPVEEPPVLTDEESNALDAILDRLGVR